MNRFVPPKPLVGCLMGWAILSMGVIASPAQQVRPETHIRASQLGYPTGGTKFGIAFGKEPLVERFLVLELDSGKLAWEGAVRPITGAGWGPWNRFAELDFSGLTRTGRFALKLGDTTSLPFVISAAPFARFPDAHLEFMRQQRCGFNPWLNTNCHQLDGRTAYGPLPSGTFLDARGGWHDAGDLLKYLLTSANATAQLLLSWELQKDQGLPSATFGDQVDATGQAPSNGIPDVLDEARWGLDWMLNLHPTPDQLYHQVADDRDHWGWRLPQNERADYGWGKGGARVVYAADGRPQGLGRFHSESTGLANLAGRYTTAMALAFQIWSSDPRMADFAQRCLRAGCEVYELGKAKEGVQQGNSHGAPYRYAETTWADDMEWGAAELFRATKDPGYLEDAQRYARLAGSESWMGREEAGHYQFYPFINVGHYRLYGLAGGDFDKLLEGWYAQGLEHCQRAAEGNPFGVGVPFIWCSNNLVAALVTQSALYQRMTGRTDYSALAVRGRDWLAGRNPWGTTMFTGLGQVWPRNVHLMTARLTGRLIRGGLVDGPVREKIFGSLKGVDITRPDPLAEFQDVRAVYHDDVMDYSTNEPTMDGTASAVLMWAAVQAASL